MNIERVKIAAKIRALLAKTTDNGCSEDEALAAAFKAKELMDKYSIDLTEAELVADGYAEADTVGERAESFSIQYVLWEGVSKFTETRVWINKREEHFNYGQFTRQDDLFGGTTTGGRSYSRRTIKSLRFFGFKGDVVFAEWLMKALENYIVRAADSYMANLDAVVKRGKRKRSKGKGFDMPGYADNAFTYEELMMKRESFIAGAAQRVNQRLLKAWVDREAAKKRGHGLIINKPGLIAIEMARRGIVLAGSESDKGFKQADMEAAMAGLAHGENARFDRPVNAGQAVKRIRGN